MTVILPRALQGIISQYGFLPGTPPSEIRTSISGSTGETGPSGSTGAAGQTGPTGSTGTAGTNGSSGGNGSTGATGVTGPAGSDAPKLISEIAAGDLLITYPTTDRSLAFGSTAGNGLSTTSTASALIYLNGTNGIAQSLLAIDAAAKGKALVVLNETGDQALLTASASGITKFTVDHSGDILASGYFQGLSANTTLRASGTGVGQSGSGSIYFQDSTGIAKGRLDTTQTGLDLGDGKDGAYATSSSVLMNDNTTSYFGEQPITTTSGGGQTTVSVVSTWNFSVGDEVLLIQMQGSGAGNYEFRKIGTVNSNTSLVMTENLNHTYTKDSTSSAQIVEVPHFTTVSISGAATITPPSWNGNRGGILIFRATGAVTCSSSAICFSTQGSGFRGGASSEAGSGIQGEGIGVTQTGSTARRYDGGGGGTRGASGGGGAGGGGYIGAGNITGGAQGGKGVQPNDMSRLYLGGGGGGGGDDSGFAGVDGGAGGAGGGILYISADTIMTSANVASVMNSNGVNGSGAPSNNGGGGGGGAGGAVWLRAKTLQLTGGATQSQYIDAGNGSGGGGLGTGTTGVAGGNGIIHLDTADMTGSPNGTTAGTGFYIFYGGAANTYGTFNIGKIDTQAADVAEMYQSEQSLEPGDIVTIADTVSDQKINPKFAVTNSTSPGKPILGAVSTEPGMILGNLDIPDNYRTFPVALNGRTPVKVMSKNGVIHKGDGISVSPLPGIGQKTVMPGYIVGYALESFDPETSPTFPCPGNDTSYTCGSVMTFIQPGWYDPYEIAAAQLTADQLSGLLSEATASGAPTPSLLESMMRPIIAAQSAFIGSMRTGVANITNLLTANSISVDNLSAGNISIGGTPIKEYILQTLGSQATPSAHVTESSASATPSAAFDTFIHNFTFTNIIRFLSDVFFGGHVTFSGPVTINNQATFSGQLTFPDNTAGSAVISKYSSAVDVVFPHPFAEMPTVTFSLVMPEATNSAFITDGMSAVLTNVTPRGFSIVLDQLAIRDYTYNWIAVQVNGRTVTVSRSLISDATVSASASISAEPTEIIATPSGTF